MRQFKKVLALFTGGYVWQVRQRQKIGIEGLPD